VKWLEPLFVVSESDGMNDAVKLGMLPGDIFGQLYNFVFIFDVACIDICTGEKPGDALFMCSGLNHIDDLCLCLGKDLADEVGDAFLVGHPEYDKRSACNA
jgi:hypothetical protein